LEEKKLLSPLIFIYFIFVIQTLAEDGAALPQEVLTDPIERAAQLQQQASKLIKENLGNNFFIHNFLEYQHSQKGCPIQGLKGKNGTPKVCTTNTTPPVSQRASDQRIQTLPENDNQILVFVSFSMPEASLKGLTRDAQQHNAVLIMRGLYQNSFAKTAQKLQELGISVDIHPELFETHHVTSVPTFVRLEDGQPIYRLKGNVTLDFVVKTFEGQKVKEVP